MCCFCAAQQRCYGVCVKWFIALQQSNSWKTAGPCLMQQANGTCSHGSTVVHYNDLMFPQPAAKHYLLYNLASTLLVELRCKDAAACACDNTAVRSCAHSTQCLLDMSQLLCCSCLPNSRYCEAQQQWQWRHMRAHCAGVQHYGLHKVTLYSNAYQNNIPVPRISHYGELSVHYSISSSKHAMHRPETGNFV
jgi:hypothetical protein